MLGIENNVGKTKNTFDGLTSWLDTVEEKISEEKYTERESSKTKKHREKKIVNKKNNIQGLWDIYKDYKTCIMGISDEEGTEKSRRNIWNNNE